MIVSSPALGGMDTFSFGLMLYSESLTKHPEHGGRQCLHIIYAAPSCWRHKVPQPVVADTEAVKFHAVCRAPLDDKSEVFLVVCPAVGKDENNLSRVRPRHELHQRSDDALAARRPAARDDAHLHSERLVRVEDVDVVRFLKIFTFLDRDEIDRRVRESAALVGLTEDQLEKSPFELSGGQKRRVAIAGVIAMEPKVLILDEPTAGLDPRGREAILAQIRAYHQKRGTTVILVSHSMEEIACNVDRILVLRGSHVYMDGTPRQVFRRASDLEEVGLDVPQATKIALALRRMGLNIDTAVYTVDELEQALLSIRGEAGVC